MIANQIVPIGHQKFKQTQQARQIERLDCCRGYQKTSSGAGASDLVPLHVYTPTPRNAKTYLLATVWSFLILIKNGVYQNKKLFPTEGLNASQPD